MHIQYKSSPSGDTDILVLFAASPPCYRQMVIIDSNSVKDSKSTALYNIDLSERKYIALLGLHAFTGNDDVSSFPRKGKEMCWKLRQKREVWALFFTIWIWPCCIRGAIVYICEQVKATGGFSIKNPNEKIIFNLKNIVKNTACCKSSKGILIDVIFTSRPIFFCKTSTLTTGLSNFHKLITIILRSSFKKLPFKEIVYGNYKYFDPNFSLH